MKAYRYSLTQNFDLKFSHKLTEYDILSETNKGFWIEHESKLKFVKYPIKGDRNKRFAYLSKDLAFEAFKHRVYSWAGHEKKLYDSLVEYINKPIEFESFVFDAAPPLTQDDIERFEKFMANINF